MFANEIGNMGINGIDGKIYDNDLSIYATAYYHIIPYHDILLLIVT